ncbi:MAG TPA: Gfo/Idh/MocA family oxidoreductase [Candidatus Nanopelagicales bacterium]|nr:Gfo/Idh/MocA family oxidoreductase [Candidatus Nanopelagicales bacterium]
MRRISDIGAAVIGSGFIGTVHIEALRRLGVRIHGLLEVSPEHGAKRAADLGLPGAYADMEEMLADERVEVVHVTSPNALHFPQVREILAAGKHVVCEKPLATTSADSAELVRLAAEAGVVNAVNFNIRFYPLNRHAAQMVRDGELGEVRLVTGHYFQDWLLLDTDWNWRLDPAEGGSLRAVGDIGSHWLDLVATVTGQRVVEVMADLATFVKVRQQPAGPVETFSTERAATTIPREMVTDDAATILLRFDGGARGAVSISQVSAGRKNSVQWEVDGSAAAAWWDSERPDELWLGRRERPNELLIRNPALMNAAGTAAASLPGGHVEGFGDTFKATYRAVYADVAAGGPAERPAYPTFADGHDEMLVNDAIATSAREGRWTAVDRGA